MVREVAALRRRFFGHDRVFVISDTPTMTGYQAGGATAAARHDVPPHGVTLGGYQPRGSM